MKRGYYTVEEVAEFYAVAPDTIRRMCRGGKIPGAKQFGRRWRIPAKFLEDNISLETDRSDKPEKPKK